MLAFERTRVASIVKAVCDSFTQPATAEEIRTKVFEKVKELRFAVAGDDQPGDTQRKELERWGMCWDPAEGLEAFARRRFSVIICDQVAHELKLRGLFRGNP